MTKIKITVFLAIIGLSINLAGCRGPEEGAEKEVTARVPVTVTGILTGTLIDYFDLTASSAFLNKSVVLAPASGYVYEVKVVPGEEVMKNREVVTIKTKEASALRGDTTNPFSFSGLITMRTSIDGIVTAINHPKGDYIMEGEPLVSIAVPGSFVFIMEVPFEMTSSLPMNSNCDIILPDGTHIQGKIGSKLPIISGNSQTQKYVIHIPSGKDLPENLLARVRIPKKVIADATLLPKACILADEMMKNFWVMKLICDSVAVRIPVVTGLSQGDNMEILSPVFSKDDRFLSSGNYGLADTARIIIENRK
ncbi:MAG: HlyD family efflux transporter periplasmic adaptor subunit [Bacteroidota bacterium]